MSTEVLDEDAAIQLFEICLHREEYFPGEVVTGKLLLLAGRPLKTEGIYIRFEGKGFVKWKKRSAQLCGLQEAEFVQEKKKYFSNVFRYDFDSLSEGCSVLTFEFELPTGIPQSIESGTIMRQLKIFYSLEALVRLSTEEYKQQKNFTVKSILNLNAYPELAFPICKTIMEAVFESCWSSSGRVVGMSFSTNKQGFVPGEQIKAELVIKDGYKEWYESIMPGLEVHLIQEVELKIPTASRIIRRIIGRSDLIHVVPVTCGEKSKHGESKVGSENKRKLKCSLKIPESILTSYENTDKQVHDFISIRYFIRMYMEQTSFPYKPLQIHLPIKIGTVLIKEQKGLAPILLLAPVPLALPRPRMPLDAACKRNHNSFKQDKPSVAEPPPQSSKNINSIPKLILNSKTSLALSDNPMSSSNYSSPRTPRRKLGNANVGDSSGSLCKPMEAFGCDSDSESFRSGLEELSQI